MKTQLRFNRMQQDLTLYRQNSVVHLIIKRNRNNTLFHNSLFSLSSSSSSSQVFLFSKKEDLLLSMYLLFALFITLLIDAAFSAIPTPNQQSRNTTTTLQTPVYNIGIIFPNATDVRKDDPSLGDMIVTSELAIQLANDAIKKSNILPGMSVCIAATIHQFTGSFTWKNARCSA